MDGERAAGGPRAPTLLAVAGLAAASMAPALFGDFVLDDRVAVMESQCVIGPLDFLRIASRNFWCQAPGSEAIDAWRPWPVLSWWFLWRLGQGAAWLFHAVNIVLHAATACQIARLAWLLLPAGDSSQRAGSAALIAGCLFAVLPIHADAVASVVGVAELWSLFFGLIGLELFVRGNRDGVPPARALVCSAGCLVAVILALCSKESAVVFFPLLVVLWAIAPAGVQRSRTGFFLVLAAGLATLAYLAARAHVLGATISSHVDGVVNPLVDHPWIMRLPMALELLWRYLTLAATGQPLSADYSFDAVPVVAFGHRVLLGGVALVALAAIAWWRRRDPVLVLVLWFLGAFAVISNVLTPLPAIFAERLFYGPSAPLCLVAGVLGAPLVAKKSRLRRPVMALLAIYLALSGVLSVLAAHAWTTEDRITAATVASAPTSARAHVWRARALGRQGDAAGSEMHARWAIAILPGWGSPHALLAAARDMQGRPNEALAGFQRAFDRSPDAPEVADLFIQFLLRHGHVEKAREIYRGHIAARGGAPSPRVRIP